jgi:hypothetical protein
MKAMNLIAGVVLLAGVTAAHADPMGYKDADFGCVAQQQADKYIQDFSINTESFGGIELCDNKVDTKKLFNDLQIIEQGQFDETLTNKLITGVIPANEYYSWMKTQTRGMDRGNDIPYATAYNSMGYFTMQDGWAKSSTLGRVGVVIHEARHTAGYRHYPCTQGPYKGASLDGCDQDYAQEGSHAVEMEYYARVSVAGKNFHPVYKAMARLMAMGRSNFVFNTSPIQQREAILAMDEQTHTPVIFEGTKKLPREGNDFVGHLKRTSFGAAVFNGIQAVALDLYEITGYRPSNDDDYSYFKLLKMSEMGALKDFEEFDRNQQRYVAVVTGANKLATYNFPRGTWNNASVLSIDVDRTATALPSGEQGYFLITRNGEIHSVNPENQQVSSTGKTWDSQAVSVAKIGDKILTLKKDGVIYQKTAGGAESAFDDGKYSEMVSVPLYDAFEVK